MREKWISICMSVLMITAWCSGCQNVGNTGREDNSGNLETFLVTDSDTEGTQIEFSDSGILTDSEAIEVDDNCVRIQRAGCYVLSGEASDGQLIVDADKEDEIELVLNGLTLTCNHDAPIKILQAKQVTIRLADESVNTLTDGENYELDADDNTDAVIFSKDDLILTGEGSLTINANYKHGIVGKDELEIQNGTYTITAVEDGMNANDALIIENGNITITAGDDGIHADEVLTIHNGTIDIVDCYEGLEGHQVIINDGNIHIVASDDGINSNSGSGFAENGNEMQWDAGIDMTVPKGVPGERNDDRMKPEGAPDRGKGGNPMEVDQESKIEINGGSIIVNASGDGLDSNGTLNITNGEIYISGAENDGNSAIDFGIEAAITGGTVIAAGFSGMAEPFSNTSTQRSSFISLSNLQQADTKLVMKNQMGEELVSWVVPKAYNCVLVSFPEMQEGATYTLETETESMDITISE